MLLGARGLHLLPADAEIDKLHGARFIHHNVTLAEVVVVETMSVKFLDVFLDYRAGKPVIVREELRGDFCRTYPFRSSKFDTGSPSYDTMKNTSPVARTRPLAYQVGITRP